MRGRVGRTEIKRRNRITREKENKASGEIIKSQSKTHHTLRALYRIDTDKRGRAYTFQWMIIIGAIHRSTGSH